MYSTGTKVFTTRSRSIFCDVFTLVFLKRETLWVETWR